MRRLISALAATGALALAAIVGPVLAGQVSPAAAATVHAQIQGVFANCPLLCYHYELFGEGVGNQVSLVNEDGSTFKNTGQSGKWTEIKDTSDGYCLNLVGSASAGYSVNEESCNDRSAELWWVVKGLKGKATQIISQYGTKRMRHDACMWQTEITNPVSTPNLEVVACKSKQPAQQLWKWIDTS
jgi:hypothetical protein